MRKIIVVHVGETATAAEPINSLPKIVLLLLAGWSPLVKPLVLRRMEQRCLGVLSFIRFREQWMS